MQTFFVVLLAVFAIAYCDTDCISEPLDLALILDDSKSINSDEWNNVRNFSKKVVDMLGDVSSQGSQVAIVQFSNEAEVIVNFNNFKDAEHVKKKIDNIDRVKGQTYINKALETTNSEVFKAGNGMRDNIKRVAILLTDGKNTAAFNSDLSQISQLLKNKNVTIFVVGIGDGNGGYEYDPRELTEIATDPSYVYRINGFEDLASKVMAKLGDELCVTPPPTDVTPPTDVPPPPVTHCQKPLDLALLLDSSNSISRVDWPKVKSFAKEIVSKLDISDSPQGSQVSIITYSTEIKVNLKFNTLSGDKLNAANISKWIDGLVHLKGRTFMDKALLTANHEVFIREAGMRDNVEKVIVLMTDGKQTIDMGEYTPLKDASQLLKDKGVKILVVGVGPDLNVQELVEMATIPNDVYTVSTFDDLLKRFNEIQIVPC